jgi:GNAT superfamily N-acetyltransferase
MSGPASASISAAVGNRSASWSITRWNCEPLETDPAYRRRGLGRALLLLGLHSFRGVGAHDAVIASRGDERMPLPALLYESVGFRELSRQRPLVLAPSSSVGAHNVPAALARTEVL